jgi:spore coat polysaccharide biosynthesis protein SpsF
MKIGIITQARTTSSRLPAKILLKANNQTLLEHHIQRLSTINIPLFVATTINQQDNVIVDICKKKRISFYRGSELHVLSRFYECALNNDLEIIIRVTSDCPLIDSQVILKGLTCFLQNYKTHKKLYLSNTIHRTFPKGMDFEIFTFKMLQSAYEGFKTDYQKEHVTPYFYQGVDPDIKLLNFSNARDTSDLRLTLDYFEDFTLLKILIESYQASNHAVEDIEDLIMANANLIKLNQLCKFVSSQIK